MSLIHSYGGADKQSSGCDNTAGHSFFDFDFSIHFIFILFFIYFFISSSGLEFRRGLDVGVDVVYRFIYLFIFI